MIPVSFSFSKAVKSIPVIKALAKNEDNDDKSDDDERYEYQTMMNNGVEHFLHSQPGQEKQITRQHLKMTLETQKVRSDKWKPRMLLRHRTSWNIIEHHRIMYNGRNT